MTGPAARSIVTPVTQHRSTEERRAQILDAARDCFLVGGYHATRVQEIATSCGLSKGAVYFHFENKRALLTALVCAEFERASRVFDAAEAHEQPLPGVLSAFTDFLGDPEDSRHRFFLLTGELAMQDEALRALLTEHHQAVVERLARLLRVAAERAGIRLEDPESAAVLLKAMADGLQGAAAIGQRYERRRLLDAALALLPLT